MDDFIVDGDRPESLDGTVRRVEPRRVLVETAAGIIETHVRGGLRVGPRHATHVLTVGDRVRLGRFRGTTAMIEEILPRRNSLSRCDPGDLHREQVLAANLDQLVIVVSLHLPRLNLRGLDRLLVLGEWSKIPARLLLNKLDLAGPLAEHPAAHALDVYSRLGIPLLPLSASTGEGIEELFQALAGKLSILFGPSGAGKSTILNRLVPGLDLRSRPVSQATGKGVHTTTRVEWIPLPGGGVVLDAPGIRAIHPWGLTPAGLADCFPEFRSRDGCRFPDCRHRSEPGCKIVEGVEKGEVAPFRYESYLRILESLE